MPRSMKNRSFLIPVLVCTLFSALSAQIHHRLGVTIEPATGQIRVTDTIELPRGQEVSFLLNEALVPRPVSRGLSLTPVQQSIPATDIGMDRDDAGQGSGALRVTRWRIAWQDRYPVARRLVISYAGTIAGNLNQSKENYQRGFAESPGIISDKGVYLAGSTYWIPAIGDTTVTFDLTVRLPRDWKSVSQGKRVFEAAQDDHHVDSWQCVHPQEEVFLIAARFYEYSRDAGQVRAMAFLRTPDEGLADKYLEATARYLQMYRSMLGPYPYEKFALVENFWETGYGMPSFTLLGEKIIRFPFILYSSYPHELLHNWWGNSVYVDFSTGNWCEGLTAYMADHLLKEQRGKGAEYRRSTLQKFTDLVHPDNDFPLTAFRSRYDGPSEAIGYGKSLMMWHMLRRKFGDEAFLEALRLVYKHLRFQRAGFIDFREAFEAVTHADLKDFFDQWTTRTGAPLLVLDQVNSEKLPEGGYQLTVTLTQRQEDPAFTLDVPIHVVTARGTYEYTKPMTRKRQRYVLTFATEPQQVLIDPQFDLFRRLDPHEVPPALTKAYGAGKTIIILPQSGKLGGPYRDFVKQWTKAHPDRFEVHTDADFDRLPPAPAVWVLGENNRFAPLARRVATEAFSVRFSADSVAFPAKTVPAGHHQIMVLPHPAADSLVLLYFTIRDGAAVPGLVRKLPHYGKYGYLAFEGTEPSNTAKGQWPVLHSPLIKRLVEHPAPYRPQKRSPLATLEGPFSKEAMMAHIRFLASEKLKGRGLGTPELDEAAHYIADAFRKAGLKPYGDKNTYFQSWTADVLGRKRLQLTNVLACIPGTDSALSRHPVVLSAHYDHLGTGWPDAHRGDEGKIHYGADDNASGVAILLELARVLGKSLHPKRTIIFAAFTGEEAGLVGSRHFVAHSPTTFFANVNLDTEGSLGKNKLLVLNANTAREWRFIFMGTDYVTGVPTQVVTKDLDASDQVAFIEKQIPAVQLFAGAAPHYHRPTDTPDKIDADGLVKIASVAKEVIVYLGDREKDMAFTGPNAKAQADHPHATGRRASTGSIPDFTYEGKGVRLGEVPPGSPAARAGLQKGDILVEMADTAITDLRSYSALLKKLRPGQRVKVAYLRDGKMHTTMLTLKAR